MNTTVAMYECSAHHHANCSGDKPYPLLKLPTHMIVVYGIAYSIIFIVALFGNLMIVIVVTRTPRMHSVTNLFLANLAVADILVAVLCIPMTFLDNIFTGWPFGALLCKLTPYTQGVSVCASVYSLTATAMDRYLAICFHPRWRIMKRGACIILCLIWICSLTLSVPWLLYYQQFIHNSDTDSSQLVCGPSLWPDFDSQRAFYVVAILIGTYLLPLAVVFFCYFFIVWRVWHRQAPGVVGGNRVIKRCRMNVVKMLLTVVLLFAFCWLPFHAIFIKLYFDPPPNNGKELAFITEVAMPIAQWLELSNSAMNAFIYSIFSANFRRGFILLWACITRRKKHPTADWNGKSNSQRVTGLHSEDSFMLARYSMGQPSTHIQTADDSLDICMTDDMCDATNRLRQPGALQMNSSAFSLIHQSFL